MAVVQLIPFDHGGLLDLPAGSSAFELQMPLPGDESFPGHPHRHWTRFRSEGEGATFEWRTGAQQVRDVGRAYAAGEMPLSYALSSDLVRRHFQRVHSAWRDEDPRIPARLQGQALADWALRWVARSPAALFELVDEPLSFYRLAEDARFHDASDDLSLPPWARRHAPLVGAEGSWRRSAMIGLAPGKTLGDLAAWLRPKDG